MTLTQLSALTAAIAAVMIVATLCLLAVLQDAVPTELRDMGVLVFGYLFGHVVGANGSATKPIATVNPIA